MFSVSGGCVIGIFTFVFARLNLLFSLCLLQCPDLICLVGKFFLILWQGGQAMSSFQCISKSCCKLGFLLSPVAFQAAAGCVAVPATSPHSACAPVRSLMRRVLLSFYLMLHRLDQAGSSSLCIELGSSAFR